MKEKCCYVAVGGTFDSLHEGHKLLLRTCFKIGKKVIIGLTSDSLAKGKSHYVPPFSQRKRKIELFLQSLGVLDKAKIIMLEDAYGPTISDKEICAIVVSEETFVRALEINRIRKSRGLPPLDIIVVELIKDKDLRPISSAKIRRRELNWKSFLNI
ncbi:MAG: pantetheine-phosphate adenylyltransferase [archaeon GB-1867-035]|nr:pantetheine-phosphate adenylyltransferase [Candidatus Culexmicrobium profundum]